MRWTEVSKATTCEPRPTSTNEPNHSRAMDTDMVPMLTEDRRLAVYELWQ